MAAEQEHVGAQSVLDCLNITGTAVPRDDGKAEPWLRRAADGGDMASANNIGILYALGQGVAQNDVQAERWFSAAIAKGYVYASRNLEVLRSNSSRTATPVADFTRAAHPAMMQRKMCIFFKIQR